MKNIKDRTIRIENIPKGKVLYQAIEGFRYTFFVMFLFTFSMMMLNTKIYLIIIILVLIYLFLSGRYKVKFEVRQDFIVHYLEDGLAEIIYYTEIINYQVKASSQNSIELSVLLDDESEYKVSLLDNKVIYALDQVIGEKRVGK